VSVLRRWRVLVSYDADTHADTIHAMSDSSQIPKHRWLKWVGLQEPPVDPDAWMAVAKDLGVDDAETGFCEQASRIADALKAAGIEAHQRVYARPDQGRNSGFTLQAFVGGLPAANRVRVAVVVQNRDLERAQKLVAELQMSQNGGVRTIKE
jgi:hypothetical protein